ncbi:MULTISPECIES: organomercurial lyase [unclassified Nocardia]|uniref:organomercurial lyase n=1 Tax=unclassified Nocardia TaxID=2637762 RepID=UPI00278C77CC|nr:MULTISPECIES: organomercurial lyase [unclassified Nocardia]
MGLIYGRGRSTAGYRLFDDDALRCVEAIHALTVHPDSGIADLEPPDVVVSLPGPDELDQTRVRATTCHPGRYVATLAAAADWRAEHPPGSCSQSPTLTGNSAASWITSAPAEKRHGVADRSPNAESVSVQT